MLTRVAALPTELVGLLLHKTTVEDVGLIPHALRLACVRYMGAQRCTSPTFDLNEVHCARRYGISRHVFQAGLRLLKKAGIIISRTQTGPRRLSVDTYRSFGSNFVPVPEYLLTERPNVLALYILTRMRIEPSLRAEVCLEFGVSSANTQKKLVGRLVELDLIESVGRGCDSLLIAVGRPTHRAAVLGALSAPAIVKKPAVTNQPAEDVKNRPTQLPRHLIKIASPNLQIHGRCGSRREEDEVAVEINATGAVVDGLSQLPTCSHYSFASPPPLKALQHLGNQLVASLVNRGVAVDAPRLLSAEGLHGLARALSCAERTRWLKMAIQFVAKGAQLCSWEVGPILRGVPGQKQRDPAASLRLHYLDTANPSLPLPAEMRRDRRGLQALLGRHGDVPWGARDLFGKPTFEEALEVMHAALSSAEVTPVSSWKVFEPCLRALRNQEPVNRSSPGYAAWRTEIERDEALLTDLDLTRRKQIERDFSNFSTSRAQARARAHASHT